MRPNSIWSLLLVRPLLLLLACATLFAGSPARSQVAPPDPEPSFAPHVGGQWGPVLVWPHVPVSMANLPDGRVLTFASNEPNSFPGSLADEYTHAAVWDPATGEIRDVPHPNHDMFCAALVTLESGEPFVMGGRNQGDSPWTSYFDFWNDQWVQIEDMNRGRWYPTAVYLGNGEVMIAAGVGGGVNPERWSPETGWKLLTGIDLSSPTDSFGQPVTPVLLYGTRDGSGSWPMLQLAPDGTVFHHGAVNGMATIDPFGGPNELGTIKGLGPHGMGFFPDEGVSVLYDEGKILVAGGSTDSNTNTSIPNAWTIDIVSQSAPVVAVTGSMNYPRQFQNEVPLPTGEILVLGGNTSGEKFTDAFAIKNAESWDPESGTWTLLNAQDQARGYHSTAVLLTDGRVLSGGGGLGGNSCTPPEGPGECGADHWNAEVFSPPYLFNSDGSLATRPQIESAPGVSRVGATVTLQATPGLTGFTMVRMSATTHTMNTDQRLLAPSFVETAPGTYDVTFHANENVLVPGYWMLFALAGGADPVPSVAHVIQVVNDGTPRGRPIAGLRNNVGDDVLQQIHAADPDGNPITFGAAGLPDGLSIDPVTGVIDGTTTQAGVFNVAVTASDGTEAAVVSFPWVVSTVRSEIGSLLVSQTDRTEWHHVDLASAFQQPIVVMGPLTLQDGDPATLRVRNVTPTSFEFQIEEWLYEDGAHGQEEVSYLVVEAGEYLLPGGGGAVVAGRSVGIDYDNPRTQVFPTGAFQTTPLVLAQVATHNGSLPVVTRVDDVTPEGFELRIQDEEAQGNNLPIEEVHWIALEPASVPGLLDAGVSPSVDEVAVQVDFSQAFGGLPHVLAGMQTRNGSDPAGLRRTAATTASVDLLVEEEASLDAEVDHAYEQVGWLAVDPSAGVLGLLPLFNGTPTLATPAAQVTPYGDAVSLFVLASDPDGDTLAFSATGLPPGLAIDPATGEIFGDATTAGAFAVAVAVSDTSAASASAVFVWTVLEPPLALLPIAAPPTTVGTVVAYDAATDAPAPPGATYEWSFGDGNAEGPSTATTTTHTYATPGRYIITLRVTNPLTLEFDELQFVQNITGVPTPLRPTASSSIAYEAANAQVFAVNPDNDSVSVVDALTNTGIDEIAVCDGPRSVAVAGDGRVWVTCKEAAAIDVIDPVSRTVVANIALAIGSAPYGVAFDPSGAVAYVALEAGGRILALDGLTGAELASQPVGPGIRGLAVSGDGATVLASRHVTPPLPGEALGTPAVTGVGGEVLALDATTLAPLQTYLLAANLLPDSEQSARGIPNYLGAPAISPQGDEALTPSKQDNVLRGSQRDGQPLTHDSTVRAITSRIDLVGGAEDLGGRLDHDNASIASAVIYSRSGAYAFTALEGNRQVSVVDPFTHYELGRVQTGRAPHGLAISPDGTRLYVDDFMERTISVFDLTDLIAYDDAALPLVATISKVAVEALPAQVLTGKQLFYDAADPRLVLESYMACAACHNEGGQDGRTWDFSQFGEGQRNTIGLLGHGQGHGPPHWTANFDEIQDFEGQIRGFTLGTGLMSDPDFAATSAPFGPPKAGLSADLDALAAYVESLTQAGVSPQRAAGGALTPEGVSGRAVFAAAGCGACHSGSAFTDSATLTLHDVGTLKPSSGPHSALDTPTLRGLWLTAPYLHDGSAATLDAAVLAHTGVILAGAELDDLVSYLAQIDDLELAAPNGLAVFTDPGAQSFAEGQSVSLAIVATDPEGALLTFSATNLPTGLAIDPLSGEIAGELDYESAGPYASTITATDGVDPVDLALDWNIAPTNRAPLVTDPGPQTHGQGAVVNLPIAATDPDGDGLSWSAVGLPPSLAIDAGTGTISGTLDADAAGAYSPTVTVTDGTAPVDLVIAWAVEDQTPPAIGFVWVARHATSARVYWFTDEPATSQVDYGLTTAYTDSAQDGALETEHKLDLASLAPDTTYHFEIVSTDASGNPATTLDASFTTKSSSRPACGLIGLEGLLVPMLARAVRRRRRRA